MKQRINLTLLTVATLATAVGTQAGELGHYMPGVLNIRDFFVPEPGFYYAQYHYLYIADTLKNRNGDEVEASPAPGPWARPR